jgi:aspartyl-tRNA(Asn)/glutamyl-tRNA(Gln) amidotransferase subunit C
MAVLDDAVMEGLARQSRLDLDDVTRARMRADLERALAYVASLASVDLDGVEPTVHVMDLDGVLREDTNPEVLSAQTVLALAPDVVDGHVRVPRALHSGERP